MGGFGKHFGKGTARVGKRIVNILIASVHNLANLAKLMSQALDELIEGSSRQRICLRHGWLENAGQCLVSISERPASAPRLFDEKAARSATRTFGTTHVR